MCFQHIVSVGVYNIRKNEGNRKSHITDLLLILFNTLKTAGSRVEIMNIIFLIYDSILCFFKHGRIVIDHKDPNNNKYGSDDEFGRNFFIKNQPT